MGESMIASVVARWHHYLHSRSAGELEALLDDDVVFYSPIVYTPQRGRAVTIRYLQAASQTLPGEPAAAAGGTATGAFRYTREVLSGDSAVLEFETSIGGTYVNGVDIIRCDDHGRIVEFRVMIRPLQAVNLVHRQMAAALEA